MLRFGPTLLLLPLSLVACATPTTDPQELPAGDWSLDPHHASVTWQVQHMGLSWYTGRFDHIEARLDFDPAEPEAARLTALIDPRSISTGDPDFDDVLAEDWFHAGRHPQIVFTSDRVRPTGPQTGTVTGQLTLNGRTSDIELDVTFNGGLDNFLEGRSAIGFSATTTLNRTAFGIGALPQEIVGDTVRVSIEVEFLLEENAS
jgi:polyisoprenoid-binding protein YceI